jgi:hypothetical protein
MRIRNALITTATAGTLMLVGIAPAVADGATNFGTHVRDCHNSMDFSGSHNPGMHRGAAGWDGRPCP